MPERGSSCRNTSRSANRGITFSIPISAMCVRGTLVVSRAFPSFSRIRIVPVSATAKLTPLMPRSASAKRRRSAWRAAAVNAAASSEGSIPSFSANRAAICPFVLWIAGATMCDGVSPAS